MRRVSSATVYLTVKLPCGDLVNLGVDLGLSGYECQDLDDQILAGMAAAHMNACNAIGALIERPRLSEGLH